MPAAMGFDTDFLGLSALLPAPAASMGTVRLEYTHFTVVFRPDRRLAAVTGVNIHGGLLVDIERVKDVWLLDSRVPAGQQTGAAVYAGNDFDRGHMVRRRDPDWGTLPVARKANRDTFHYTNAAPQVSRLNQSPLLWAGLENYLLEHAATYDQRLSVFTGPVLDAADPLYRGVQIPLRFWKIAAWLQDDHLATSGYVLDQTDLVGPVLAADAVVAGAEVVAPPPLGAFKTFQVPVGDIAAIADLTMPDLVRDDVLQPAAAVGAQGCPAVDLTVQHERHPSVLNRSGPLAGHSGMPQHRVSPPCPARCGPASERPALTARWVQGGRSQSLPAV